MFHGVDLLNVDLCNLLSNKYTKVNFMSNKKYTNVEVCEIHSRIMSALGLSKKIGLSKLLNISTQTLKNREDRGVNNLDDIELLCNKEGISKEWVFAGKGEMFIEKTHPLLYPDLSNGALIVIDEQHRSMVKLMESAPGREAELLALVKGYLAGKKAE